MDCEWSEWSWTPCSKPCENGSRNGTRTILQEALNDGAECEDKNVTTESCNQFPCSGMLASDSSDTLVNKSGYKYIPL